MNAALLSRCKVFRLDALERRRRRRASCARALADATRGPRATASRADDDALDAIAALAQGDARRALDDAGDRRRRASTRAGETCITRGRSSRRRATKTLLYDKAGEEHYNVISAFIKSMRGSDPDAAIYWLMRMLEAGDDPLFVLRRMMIFASEDVGNADPRALEVAVAADEAFRRMGMPEGMYPIAHAALYLACAPKSNAVQDRVARARRRAVEEHGALPVPMKLRNAVTKLMKERGLRRGLPLRARLRGGRRRDRRDVPARRARRRALLRADRAGLREGHQRAARRGSARASP